MLCELSIKNFAIIDDLHISLSEGLSVLSGETGAGKSIIINAVNLILGSRASSGLIRTGAETAELEAVFEILPGGKIAETMAAHDFDPSDNLIIRRIISNQDRHKIFINGRFATIQMLKAFTENLASISGQHANQGLLNEEQHLNMLDQFAGLMPLRQSVYEGYHQLVPLLKQRNRLKAKESHQQQQIELLQFQLKEIEDAAVEIDEDKALEEEKLKLKNAGLIYQSVFSSAEELYNVPGAVAEKLSEISKVLTKAGQFDESLNSFLDATDDIKFRIEDLSQNLLKYSSSLDLDENRLDEVESRLTVLNKLKRKYGGSIKSVLAHLQSIEQELSEIENLGASIEAIESQINTLYQQLSQQVMELSQKRHQHAESMAQKIEKELDNLKMQQTRFEIAVEDTPKGQQTEPHLTLGESSITETGKDRVYFLIAPNVGEDLKPLKKIASGGELSRVVLALKAILAEAESVETLVFDEVDAGIGGGTAEVVGQKLNDLAKYYQVICITHLPQIAKFGRNHFKILKSTENGRTHTTINLLQTSERVEEIARMLGGLDITEATLEHAREMLGHP